METTYLNARKSASERPANELPLKRSAQPVQSSRASTLEGIYESIAPQLSEIEDRLEAELRSPYESLAAVLSHGTQLGGKRMRPALLLLAGRCCGNLNDDHLVLGTVVEMVHTATLIHDDVIDGATTRRHVPTVNAKWSDHASILLGDYLFAQSFRLAATLDSTEACRRIGEAARKVCEGEMRQVLHRDVLELDEETYVSMIRGKTAELCSVACLLGAQASGGASGSVKSLAAYGEALGIAFQIADDFLDLWGTDHAIGKTLGTDLEQGKATLPIIRLLQSCDPNEAAGIRRILTGPAESRWDAIRPWLRKSDAADYTLAKAEGYRDLALNALADLPACPAVDALRALADFAVVRRF